MKNFLSIVVFTILIALIISPNIAQAEKSEIEELYDTLQVGKATITTVTSNIFPLMITLSRARNRNLKKIPKATEF